MITPAPAWASRFVNASFNTPVTPVGWSLRPDEVQHFSLPSLAEKTAPDAEQERSRILLVEDNPADVGLVREALEEHQVQCELVVISNGERAIQFIQALDSDGAVCPQLIILDLNLPKKSGREVLKSVRAGVRCAEVPILILTSSDNQKDRIEAASLGASRYIRKPSRLAEFLGLGAVFKEMLGA
jgi:CheY-like chemotaxis protein